MSGFAAGGTFLSSGALEPMKPRSGAHHFAWRKSMKSVIFAAVLSALATSALAQSTTTTPATGMQGPQAQKVSSATQQCVQKAAITDLFEIQSGQLAQQKATTEDYRQFGQIIHDHPAQTSDELRRM